MLTSQNSHHVHAILDMMLQSGETYTLESLKKAVIEGFGITATFSSCSVQGMSIDQALGFLEQRGKFSPCEGGFYFDIANRCNHGEHHH